MYKCFYKILYNVKLFDKIINKSMSNNTNSLFDLNICDGDNCCNNTLIEANIGVSSESVNPITSILSLDDTLLQNIEDKACNEIQNLNSTEDKEAKTTFKTQSTTNLLQICRKQTFGQEIKTMKTTDLIKSSDKSLEDENVWKQCSLLDVTFSEFYNVDDKRDDTSQNDIFDIIDISNKSIEQNKLEDKKSIIDDINTTKKLCFDNEESTKETIQFNKKTDSIHSFYGLPVAVKQLIHKIKGFNTLYNAVKNRKNLIYALPTSGGKTLVAEILMLKEIICNKKNVIFILPFVAIVQEKIQTMTPFAIELGFLIEEYAATKGHYPPKKRRKKNTIYICTIEKALGLINSLIELKRLNEIGLLIVDELHLLGENGGRGATLESLLTKIMYINEDIHIVGMSATIGNLEEVAQFLNAELYTGTFRPIKIQEYVKCQDDMWLIDIHKEEVLTDMKKIHYPYSKKANVIDPDKIGGLVMDIVPKDSCLIFCSNRKNCENIALLMTKVLFRSLEKHKKAEKEKLLNALTREEGLCPILKQTIKFGVAYHHSGLTSEERRLLEDAFREEVLCVICCTSTLAAGINLPARRVILRSPYVGRQFLNISKYKQMIGRAGRAGLGNIGESILICRSDEIPQVKELLISKMDDSLSTLHIEKDRGINNLILSAILLSIATTRFELYALIAKSLLSVQQKRLNINIKQIMDETIRILLKNGVLKIHTMDKCNIIKSISITIPSQETICIEDSEVTNKKQIMALTSKTKLELCDLGRAAIKAGIDLQSAYELYEDLKTAQKHLILTDYLHLLYLMTPYNILNQIQPIGSVYYDAITKLSDVQMEIVRLIGINEFIITKLHCGIISKNVNFKVIQRFYVTLMIYELWNHHTIHSVAEKYQVNRGIVQNLLNTVSSFSFSVVRFCQEFDEFWAFRDLLNTFSKKLSYCCPSELEILMQLPTVKMGRAYQLYNAGYTTLQSVAKANPYEMQQKIQYLTKRIAVQIITAANLLVLERIEDLKDEVENISEEINLSNLEIF
ncbi:helicase POLQ-like isoform X3 [Vespa velutina]|uniref:helicase POLQ-like isoform X3 n=1 Tax=Vespa velutina TaxID=202808 RepID=UPI001FB35F54|nr:helicase POLQ-like isoform X3 [Vespa velutina]